MAFSSDPLDVVVELYINGAWTDITTDVLVRDGISITRGRRDEGTRTDPSKCNLSIKNVDGKYSPRNPNSPYYGKIGRNTPIRISVDTDVRFVGEVSSWPSRWDLLGNDVWVPVEAAGILRRLGQGSELLRSAMYRGLTIPSLTAPAVAYWPCEDVAGSSSLASGVGGPPMTITGSPDLAAYDGFVSSDPIPLLEGSVWNGVVPYYASSNEATLRFLLAVPDAGISGDQALITMYTSGSATQWLIRYDDSSGNLKVQSYDADGGVLLDTGFIAFPTKGLKLRVSLDLEQNGSNIDWVISTLEPGAPSGLTFNGTLNSHTFGRVNRVVVAPGGSVFDTAIGHVSVQATITSVHDLGPQLAGYDGETAGRRIERLCDEESIPFSSVGDLDDSTKMGAQRTDTLLNLLTEAAESDLGILYEPRTALGLSYRTRLSLYNQSAGVELDYEAGHLAPPLEPIDDDQAARNDITVTRRDGSSARASLDTGPLSTADPPLGVGRYSDQVTINVQSDGDLPNQAYWRLHLGTVDEARYPQVSMDLSSPGVSGDSGLTQDIIDMDIGDRLTIENQPAWLPPDLISQIVYGFSERMAPYDWDITVNCTPESPWQVAEYGTARYGTEYSTLSTSANSSTTSLSVATSKGPFWTTAPSDMPMDIVVGGERMTVTAISGASSPQTVTVTRSVNGVAKSHVSGSAVKLFTPAVRAF
ncbi:hypothetical protein Aph01nite_59190 [Acrocarpospora phusangensis]|uniref:Uncharacterized protein n=1 Tax=Acrocarpospora phusangensis TaxID=1070424 RepID=A0A919QGQ9_9ACTN|nr:hypothetical protein [Acrocarpospora phusangensis]GIH27609.1 hypothetical protein Aph01nite_59190 [Acrocarpospora phusangensis]